MPAVDPWAYAFAALLLLTVPLNWLCAALIAALIHECCHILAIRACGGRIRGLRIGIGGAVIEAEIAGNAQELLCALAGPMGSLSLVLLCHQFPRLALASGVQGLFNLLPIYPLDGGRALRCFLRLCGKADRLAKWIEVGTLICLAALCLFLSISLSLGIVPLLLGLLCAFRAISRKRPCKPGKIGVQ